MSPFVTRHAKKRVKQRVHKAYQRAAELAFTHGIGHERLTGSLKRYVDSVALRSRLLYESGITAFKIYYSNIYLFDGERLVTVMHLPQKYVRLCKRLTEENRKA
jgi:hypothetical protein